jgi:hypothetical protein
MSSGTLKLITDFIRRVPWWGWLGIAVCHGASAWEYLGTRDRQPHLISVIFAFQASRIVHTQAWLRVAETLPVTRSEIARAQWWADMGVPGALYMIVNATVLAALAIFWRVTASETAILLWFAAGWAALGIWSALRPVVALASGYNAKLGLAVVLIWLIVVLQTYTSFQFAPLPASLWVVLGVSLVGLLYIRGTQIAALQADALIAVQRRRDLDRRADRNTGSASHGFSGWWALANFQLRLSLWVIFCFGVVIAIMHIMMKGSMPPFFYLIFSPALTFVAQQAVPSPRLLRTVPATAGRLTALMQLLTIAPVAFVYAAALIWQSLSIGRLPNLAPIFMLILALQTLQLPIRFSFSFVQAQIISAMMPILVVSPLIIDVVSGDGRLLPRLSGAIVWLAAATAIAGCFWTYYELAGGNRAYRSGPPSVSGLGSFSGRFAGSGQ